MSLLDNLKQVFTFIVKNQQAIDDFAQFLLKYGYINQNVEHTVEDLVGIIRQIQVSAGLNPTGTVDAQTLGVMQWPRCACKDNIVQQVGNLQKWGSNHLTYYLNSYPSQTLTVDQWRAAYSLSFSNISAVCNLTFEEVNSANDATLIVDAVSIDGKSNILGETELPPNSNFSGQLTEHIDKDENWLALNQNGNGIKLLNVITHESIHYLGVGHCMNDPSQLMAPYYSPNVYKPQTWDIAQLQARYGPPVNSGPTPLPTPTVPTAKEIIIRIKNNTLSIDGYSIVPKN